MNRAERRREKQQENKAEKILKKLSPSEMRTMDEYVESKINTVWDIIEVELRKSMKKRRLKETTIDAIFEDMRKNVEVLYGAEEKESYN